MNDLMRGILRHYENKPVMYNQKYYNITESDSKLTKFEYLSNNNLIILKSTLSKVDVKVIFRIFQCIYDNNFWIFNMIILEKELKDRIRNAERQKNRKPEEITRDMEKMIELKTKFEFEEMDKDFAIMRRYFEGKKEGLLVWIKYLEILVSKWTHGLNVNNRPPDVIDTMADNKLNMMDQKIYEIRDIIGLIVD